MRRRLKRLTSASTSPHQLADMPVTVFLFGSSAAVHSTVWIFAINAAFTRRAFW